MRTSTLGILMVSLSMTAVPLMAQGSATSGAPPRMPPTDAQMAAAAIGARKMSHPAELVLDFKKELNLRADQITELEKLVLAQRDSEMARLSRPNPFAGASMRNPGTMAMVDWASPIDEKAIREFACEQSKATSEIMLNMIRDQHAVGAVLTEAQRTQIPMLQAKAMMSSMKQP
jgi:Spy/CpxP family protein refolding chaperone